MADKLNFKGFVKTIIAGVIANCNMLYCFLVRHFEAVMGTFFEQLMSLVEVEIGMSVSAVKSSSPRSVREAIAVRSKRKVGFVSCHPVIGRGSVLRDFYTTEELDGEVDKALKALSK